MPRVEASRAALQGAVASHGLRVRGGWVPTATDTLPAMPDGRAAAVVWMVGQIGSACWDAFTASAPFSDGQAHPMDRWSKSIAMPLAQQWAGLALFPSDGPPYLPFARWAARAEALQTSPLMLQLHASYGLWHAYRFALALPTLDDKDADALRLAAQVPPAPDLCARCDGQPCLTGCPVQAFGSAGYDVPRCAGHLHGLLGHECMSAGCLARRACPVGTENRYTAEHAAFHMASFAGDH